MFTQLSDHDAKELVMNGRIGRLGCIANDEPYIVQINYFVEDNFAYSHSLPGLKISAMRRNPKACLLVDQIKSEVDWRSAIAFGRYEEVDDAAERERVLAKMLRHFPLLTPVESATSASGPPPVIVFRLRIERITGVGEV